VELENPQVWPDGGETPRLRPGSIDKVTGAPDLQSVRRRIYIGTQEYCRSFLDIYDFVQASDRPDGGEKRLGRRIEP
jgi:hypothetical protein